MPQHTILLHSINVSGVLGLFVSAMSGFYISFTALPMISSVTKLAAGAAMWKHDFHNPLAARKVELRFEVHAASPACSLFVWTHLPTSCR